MARKVRTRIGQVLAFAKARGRRAEALPDARELRTGLSQQARGGNFAAMPFPEVPAFAAAELAKGASAGRYAVLFAILTCARSAEVRGARWEQIDLDARTWTRPASLMKMKEGHVVTLSDAAIALLDAYAPKELREGLIFLGMRAGRCRTCHSRRRCGAQAGPKPCMASVHHFGIGLPRGCRLFHRWSRRWPWHTASAQQPSRLICAVI